jgi:hypothetical protein
MTDPNSGKLDSENLKPPAMTGGETDAERTARQLRAIDQVAALSRAAVAADAPGKFSLTELMLVVTLLGVALGLIRSFGIWGWLVTFVGCVACGNFIYPRWYSAEPRRQIVMFDGIWGLLMPLVCLGCVPLVLLDHDSVWPLEFRRVTLTAWCLVLWQTAFLLAWLVGRPWLKGLAGLFLGTWVAGITFTALLGLLLVVPTAMGLTLVLPAAIRLLMSVALVGATTFLASYVLSRRSRETIALSDDSLLPFALLVTIGFLAAVMAPLQIAAWL